MWLLSTSMACLPRRCSGWAQGDGTTATADNVSSIFDILSGSVRIMPKLLTCVRVVLPGVQERACVVVVAVDGLLA